MSRRRASGTALKRTLASHLAQTAPHGVRVLVVADYTRGDSPWIDELAERLLTPRMPRCEHLRGRQEQGYVHVAEGYGRCVACEMERVASGVAGGGSTACGRCQTDTMPALLRAVAMEVDSWVMFSVICPVCRAVVVHEGQRSRASVRGTAGR